MPRPTKPTPTEPTSTAQQPETPAVNRRGFMQGVAAAAAASALATSLRAGENGSESGKGAAGAAPRKTPPKRFPIMLSDAPGFISAREAALDILKPTQAQLETGLRLHYESLVFDTYGFAPRAALDRKKLAAAIEAGASDLELQDMQEDMSMTRAATVPEERAELRHAFECAGVTCIFENAGEESQAPEILLKRLARHTYLTDMCPDVLNRAITPDDIEATHREGKHCLYLTGNGIPLAQQWVTVQEELAPIRIFFQLGIRMMHLTYNRRNMLGDGCAEPANGGISDLGREAIAELNRQGVIVDVAHSGWQTSLEAAKASSKPMVASHTTCTALNNHIRSKPDEVIKAICDTGGMVGICCIPRFLGGEGDITALLDHIDHVAKKFGVDHVGIGTDVAYRSRLDDTSVKLPPRNKRRTRFAALWPPSSLGGRFPRSTSIAWAAWPMFTVGLVQRGYSEEDIRKILGGNMMRVCREALKV